MFQSFTTVKRKTVLSFRFVRIMSIERNKRSHESENNERSTFSNVSLCAASTLMYNCVTGYRMETLVFFISKESIATDYYERGKKVRFKG